LGTIPVDHFKLFQGGLPLLERVSLRPIPLPPPSPPVGTFTGVPFIDEEDRGPFRPRTPLANILGVRIFGPRLPEFFQHGDFFHSYTFSPQFLVPFNELRQCLAIAFSFSASTGLFFGRDVFFFCSKLFEASGSPERYPTLIHLSLCFLPHCEEAFPFPTCSPSYRVNFSVSQCPYHLLSFFFLPPPFRAERGVNVPYMAQECRPFLTRRVVTEPSTSFDFHAAGESSLCCFLVSLVPLRSSVVRALRIFDRCGLKFFHFPPPVPATMLYVA